MVRTFLMSSIREMGRISVVAPFGMRDMVSSLDGKKIDNYLSQGCALWKRRARKLRVKPLWRADLGMDLMPGSIWGIEVVVVVGIVRDQGCWRAGWAGAGWNRCLMLWCAEMTRCLVSVSTMWYSGWYIGMCSD